MLKRHFKFYLAVAALLLALPKPTHAIFGAGDIVFDPTMYASQLQQTFGGIHQSQAGATVAVGITAVCAPAISSGRRLLACTGVPCRTRSQAETR